MNITQVIARELEVKDWQVEAAVKLIDEGCTIPFIARYRKEVTGTLNDEQLRQLGERLTYLRNLEERKEAVISSIREQEKLTEELEKAIRDAETLVAVEDLYRPYKQKRKTRASVAKEKGLEPLANLIRLEQPQTDVLKEAEAYISEEKGVASAQDAVKGAMDIIAETISDEADFRTEIRERTMKKGTIRSLAKDPEQETPYETYYDFQEPLKKITGYRVLALNRGEAEKVLTVTVEAPEEEIIRYLEHEMIHVPEAGTAEYLKAAVADAYSRLIAPAIEREIRSMLTETAEEGAITVFGKNLRQLLMQPPIAGKTVLGWDPAFRTGCKLAGTDPTGKVLDTAVVYPTAPTNPVKIRAAKDTVKKMIRKYKIDLISIGNGTASRESEQIVAELLDEIKKEEPGRKIAYVITNEAGASVYSASALATEEFPNFDVGQRSAASIARRLQDPLAELVKITPESIGVGQYQHDMNQKRLKEALSGVVEDCVNQVGVDLNTASASLLEYISGISKPIAKNIVAYREQEGGFTERRQLLKVAKRGPKASEQCAGFLRIRNGSNPLDNTGVHPESYEAAAKLMDLCHFSLQDVQEGKAVIFINDYKETAESLGVGEPTLRDMVAERTRPGRDPRSDMPQPVLRTDVLDMKDLTEGMILKGTVRNVIDFGAFVDIGVHQDGLVHISQLTNKKFVKHPLDVVSVGDVVTVKVLSVDMKRKRIGLSMIL